MPASADAPLTSIDSPWQVSGSDATVECRGDGEAVAERTASPGTYVSMFTLHNASFMNRGTYSPPWYDGLLSVPVMQSDGWNNGDFWATTSGLTRLNYAALIISEDWPGTRRCVGLAATESDYLLYNLWYDGGAYCLNSWAASDGPTARYDPGAWNLWLTDSLPHNLYIFRNCQTGRPGSSACPITSGPISVGTLSGHSDVGVNPCTHNGVVAFRDGSGNIKLRFYNPYGGSVATKTVRSGVALEANTSCAPGGTSCATYGGTICKCTGPGWDLCANDGDVGCLRTMSKVHIATTSSGGSCYAYLAYDVSWTASNGHKYLLGRLDIVNITNESSASVVKAWTTRPGSSKYNDFLSTVAVWGSKVAMFHYRHIPDANGTGDPCNTEVRVAMDANLALSTLSSYHVSGNFPTVKFTDGAGMSDYMRAATWGIPPQGYLFSVWAEPVSMQAGHSCIECQGQQYSSHIMGTKVLP